MSDDDSGAATPQTCAYPGCNKTFVREGSQGTVPKKYCSRSCRSRDYRRRKNEAVNHPEDAMKRAVEQALRPLSTEQAEDALRAMPPDIQRHFREVRRVLQAIRERIPDASD